LAGPLPRRGFQAPYSPPQGQARGQRKRGVGAKGNPRRWAGVFCFAERVVGLLAASNAAALPSVS